MRHTVQHEQEYFDAQVAARTGGAHPTRIKLLLGDHELKDSDKLNHDSEGTIQATTVQPCQKCSNCPPRLANVVATLDYAFNASRE